MVLDGVENSMPIISAAANPIRTIEIDELPRDKYLFVLFTSSMLGVAVLFPWNVLITANNFWSYTFGDDSDFEFYMSAVFNWPQWLSLIVFTKYGPNFTFNSRIITTLIIYAVGLILIPTICTVDINDTAKAAITLIICFFTGLGGSVLQGSIFGLLSLLPQKYLTALMSGQGIGGVIVGILAIITQGTLGNLDDGTIIQAWVYFVIAVVIILLTLACYIVMMRTTFMKFYVDRYYQERRRQEEHSTSSKARPLSWYWNVFTKIWVNAISVWFIFFITLSLFPGLMLAVQVEKTPVVWYNLIIPLEFNIFDMIGRTAPYIFVIRDKFVPPLVLSRILFYPLVIFCVNPVLFNSPEFWIYGINVIFALSNGFLSTLSLMYAPGKVQTDEQQTAGIMMAFFITFGIFCATNFAVFLSFLIVPS